MVMNPRDVLLLASGVVIGALGYHVLKEDKAINVTPDDEDYIDVDEAFRQAKRVDRASIFKHKVAKAEEFTQKVNNVASSKEAKGVVDSAKGLLDNLHQMADVYEEYFGESAKRESMHRRDNDGRRRQGPTNQTPGQRGPQGPGPRDSQKG
jgi:hypothetical protein